jgi:hypothetical protein
MTCMIPLATRIVHMSRPRYVDLRGVQCGKWLALEPTTRRLCGQVVWRCKLVDGSEDFVSTGRLKKARNHAHQA